MKFFCGFIAFIVLFGASIGRLVWPQLHMDESLYAAGAQHILNGDLFLRHLWFDKPFLVPYSIVPGILIAGNNAIGFHLRGWIFYFLDFYLLAGLVLQITQNKFSRAFPLLCLSLAFFISPLFVIHSVSALIEPMQLGFFLLFARALLRACHEEKASPRRQLFLRRAFLFFTLAMLSKLNALIWLPMIFIALVFIKEPIWPATRSFWTQTWWLWALFFFFCLTAQVKFEQISLLIHNLPLIGQKTVVSQHGVGTQVLEWLGAAGRAFTIPGAILFFCFALFASVYIARANGFAFWFFAIPFWIHFLAIIFSRASIFDKYYYLLIPQGILLFAAVFASPLCEKKWNRVGVSTFTFALALIVLSRMNVKPSFFKGSQMPNSHFAQMLYQIRDELPQNSVIHNKGLLWFLEPFENGKRLSCLENSCVEDERVGRPQFTQQYVLDVGDAKNAMISEDDSSELYSVVPSGNRGAEVSIDTSKLNSEILWRSALRLGGHIKNFSIQYDDSSPSLIQPLSSVIPGSQLQVEMLPEISCKIAFDFKDHPVIFSGKLTVSRGAIAENKFGANRWALGFRIDKVNVPQYDLSLTDLIPIIYGSYFIPLFPVSQDVPLNANIVKLSIHNTQTIP